MLNSTRQQSFDKIITEATREEIIWMLGYLSGSLRLQATAPAGITAATAPIKLSIAYGTETGNAKSLSAKLSAQAKAAGCIVKTIALDQYKPAQLAREQNLLLIVSTHGDGEAPAQARPFFDFLKGNTTALSSLNYAVIALGDSAYPLFCEAGRWLDERLHQLGAQRIKPAQLCDTDYEAAAISWFTDALQQLQNTAPETVGQANVPVAGAAASTKKNYTGSIIRNQLLNDKGSFKSIHHIEISAEGLAYKPGDSLGIIPPNHEKTVRHIIELTGVDGRKVITHRGKSQSITHWLTHALNISYLPIRVVKKYAAIVQADIPEVSIGLNDLLHIYPVNDSAQFEKVIEILEPLAPRLYSISSSPNAHSNEVHLTVKEDCFSVGDEKRKGLCSAYLTTLPVDAEIQFYIQPNQRFALPRPDADIIMIGAGTGIAPFRSFVAERAATGASGKNWLFFGEQQFVCDFLYQTEWQSHLESGVLTQMHTAFSRDQAQKIYVQHRLHQQGAQIYQWLQQGALLYVCGAKEPMSNDVEQALVQIIASQGNQSEAQAMAYLQNLAATDRYLKDVY